MDREPDARTMTDESAPLALQVRGLSKTFGTKPVLRQVDLDVRKGETVVVIGASGSGKTTLLRCVSHLELPTAGSVNVDGRPIGHIAVTGGLKPATERQLAVQRRSIGFVFQRFNLFPHLTALDNVSIGLRRVRGIRKLVARERAAEHLRKV